MELQEKYKPQLEEGTTNSVSTKLSFFFSVFFFLRDEIILHRNSTVSTLKAQKLVSPEKTHITSLTTKTNAWEWNKPKKGQI